MKFRSENERMQHPQARLIPRSVWDYPFDSELSSFQLTLMQTPSRTSYSDDIRSVVVYGLEKSAEVIERVRKSAMDDARSEAKKSATLANKTVGDVVTIGCSGSSHFNFPMRVMGRTANFPTEHIGTNPKEITISHVVSVSFEMKD